MSARLMAARVRTHVAHMAPAYFGTVMATGIVSVGAQTQHMPRLAYGLFCVNLALYAVLWLLTLIRAVCFPRLLMADVAHHLRGPGFFTLVAATGILGSEFVVIGHRPQLAAALWVFTIALWLLCTYAIFLALTVKQNKPPLGDGINGGWLLATVATQSIAVLGILLADDFGPHYNVAIPFACLAFWLCGGILYIWTAGLIFYRYMFCRLRPDQLSPAYWINMGAMAISTLAGALLIQHANTNPWLHEFLPFLKGFSLLYWALGTWWLPLLLLFGMWRYVYSRFPLRYNAVYWAAVFPLGMYAVSTHELIHALQLPFLSFIPPVFFYIALTAWLLAFLFMAVEAVTRLFGNP